MAPVGSESRPPGWIVASVRERHIDPSKVKELRAAVSDLGEGGVFIQMKDPPPKGTILEVEFEIPGRASKTRMLGIVRWREKAGPRAGVGVRFAPIGEAERAELARLVRGSAGSGAPRAGSRGDSGAGRK